jgi:hypothetical protein
MTKAVVLAHSPVFREPECYPYRVVLVRHARAGGRVKYGLHFDVLHLKGDRHKRFEESVYFHEDEYGDALRAWTMRVAERVGIMG